MYLELGCLAFSFAASIAQGIYKAKKVMKIEGYKKLDILWAISNDLFFSIVFLLKTHYLFFQADTYKVLEQACCSYLRLFPEADRNLVLAAVEY